MNTLKNYENCREWGKSRFIVVSIQNTVYSYIAINYCIIFQLNSCKLPFASPFIRFSKVSGYKSNIFESFVFLYP